MAIDDAMGEVGQEAVDGYGAAWPKTALPARRSKKHRHKKHPRAVKKAQRRNELLNDQCQEDRQRQRKQPTASSFCANHHKDILDGGQVHGGLNDCLSVERARLKLLTVPRKMPEGKTPVEVPW